MCCQCYVRCSLISCPPHMCAAAEWWLHFGTLRCRAAQPLLLLQRCPYGHHSQGGDGSFLGEEHQIQPSFVPSHLHLQVRLRVGAPTWVWGPHTPTSQGRMLTAPPSIGAFSADALPSSVPFAIPRLPLHIPHSLPFLSARIPGITECRTPTRGCRAVQEHRAVPRPTAPCPPRAPILLTDCFLCRWSLPMAMSITHRGTGVALSLGVCTSGCCGLQSCGCWRSFISPCLSSCNSAFSRGFCSLLPPHSPPHTPSAAAAPGSDAVLCLNPQSLRSTASMVSCCLLPHLPP